jgi:hypothetical protein
MTANQTARVLSGRLRFCFACSSAGLWQTSSWPCNCQLLLQGHHSAYYTTWSGPGLYAVNPGNGHVRWQFPLDNWFRYW